MAGLVPAIHNHNSAWVILDGRDKPGHDGGGVGMPRARMLYDK